MISPSTPLPPIGVMSGSRPCPMPPTPPFFALSDGVGQGIWGHEYYRLARGRLGPVDPETEREADLFAGLDV